MYTVIDCRAFPRAHFEGRRVIRTDREVDDLGVRWFEERAIKYAERYAPAIPSYHLRVERLKGLFPRYSVKAYFNRLGEWKV